MRISDWSSDVCSSDLIPVAPLVESAPLYDRPWEPSIKRPVLRAEDVPATADPLATLKEMMGSPHFASRRWIWEQYDHMVMADTVQGPGGDAAVVRVHGTGRALAMTTACTHRYCFADPDTGGRDRKSDGEGKGGSGV